VAVREIVRKCVACSTKQDRNNLIRVLQDHKTSEFSISPSSYEFGRSLYLCNKAECVTKLSKHKKYKDKINFDLLTQINSQKTKHDGRWKN
jgi:predicted RNA-binding protein YlxR (DUF448 family)